MVGRSEIVVARRVVQGEIDAVEFCDEFVECTGCKSKGQFTL